MGIDTFVGSGLSEEDKNMFKIKLNININNDENKKMEPIISMKMMMV